MSGEVPSGWTYTTLGQIADIAGGSTPSKGEERYWQDGTVAWATPTDITGLPTGDYTLSATKNAVAEAALQHTSLKLMPPGCVLMTSRATIGYAAINKFPITTNQGFAVFQPSRHFIPEFLLQWILFSRTKLENSSGGSTFKEISKSVLKTIPIQLPPLPEQRRIAEIISSVDEAIQATQAVIDQTRKVKQGVLERLLTKGIGHTRFKQTEIGEIPESWSAGVLSQICVAGGLQTGPFGSQLKASEYVDDPEGIPIVMPQDLVGESISLAKIAKTTPEKAKSLQRHTLKSGDILFGRRGDIGRCGIVSDNHSGFLCGTGCLRARLDLHKAVPEFVIAWLRSGFAQDWLKLNAVGQTMLNLNTDIIGRLPIPILPLTEQALVASAMSSLDTSLLSENKALTRLRLTKSALMADLLTGRKRVSTALSAAAE